MVHAVSTPGPLRISVVIPVKDDARELRLCLAMLRDQQLAPLEIIVVDNGSIDESVSVAQASGARVVLHPGGSIPAASAAGYDAASGDIIARLDADSRPPPDWLHRIHERFLHAPGIDAVTGAADFYDGPRMLRRPLAALYLGSYFLLAALALAHLPLFGSNLAMRTTVWRAISATVHRDDALMHDDMDLAFHLGPRRRIVGDRHLRMGISIRALGGKRRLRLRRGIHSVVAHWPHDLPWLRLVRRLAAAVRRHPEAAGAAD